MSVGSLGRTVGASVGQSIAWLVGGIGCSIVWVGCCFGSEGGSVGWLLNGSIGGLLVGQVVR